MLADRTQNDMVFKGFDFQRFPWRQLQPLTDGFRKNDASRAIHTQLGIHNGIIPCYLPYINAIELQRLENLYREPLLLLLGKPKPELFRQEPVLAAVRYGCRSRKLTKVGPKDAVQITLDDVALEHRNDPKVCPGTGRRAGFFAESKGRENLAGTEEVRFFFVAYLYNSATLSACTRHRRSSQQVGSRQRFYSAFQPWSSLSYFVG
jgi:hypothetical protein